MLPVKQAAGLADGDTLMCDMPAALAHVGGESLDLLLAYFAVSGIICEVFTGFVRRDGEYFTMHLCQLLSLNSVRQKAGNSAPSGDSRRIL